MDKAGTTKAREADITISGVALTFAQSMTVRVAIGQFLILLEPTESLGRDDTGMKIRGGYLARLAEVNELISRTAR